MDETEVIHSRLGQLDDMFRTSESDVMSPYYRFEPGIDYCISELRNRRSRSPVRLELELPMPQIDPETPTPFDKHLLVTARSGSVGTTVSAG